MPTIGLITEGPTDFQFLRLLLNGLCGSDYAVNPLTPVEQGDGTYPPTGWGNVLRYVGDTEFEEALSNKNFPVDFVVVQIDADSCNDLLAAASHTDAQDNELIENIKRRLQTEMQKIAPDFYQRYSSRIIFAVATHSLECWILPLFYTNNTRTKTVNCVEALNRQLTKKYNFSIDKKEKQEGYRKMLRVPELKPRGLTSEKIQEISHYNAGFEHFVDQVTTLINRPAQTVADAADA